MDGRQPTHKEALGFGAYSGFYYPTVIARSRPANLGEADTPSVHTSSKGISVPKTEYALSNPHVVTNCPEVSFLAECSVQPMQAEPITCHGMDTPKPGGQAYHIKSSSPKTVDHRFGPVGLLGGLSSQAGC